MKKTLLFAVLLLILSLITTVYAADQDTSRVVIGGDLTDEQINAVYSLFGIERGSVKEISIVFEEEFQHLNGLIDAEQIGQRSISCVYIEMLPEGSGLDIRTENINWCSSEMYRGALATLGIKDAKVIVAAPWAVSGTGGIAGIIKAYEDISGKSLDAVSKRAGTEELVTAAELADSIGVSKAIGIINDLKQLLSKTENMTDEELTAEISRFAKIYNVELSEKHITRLITLCRSFEKFSLEDMKDKARNAQDTIKHLTETGQNASEFVRNVKNMFRNILGFFTRIFKKYT